MERLAGRVFLLWSWPRRLAACAAGAITVLALPPFDFPAAGFFSFPILVWLLDGTPAAGAAWRRFLPAFSAGWWFGFGYFLAGMWWVGAPFLRDLGLAWALPLAVLGLPACLALFYGLATLIARLLWSDGIGRIAALAFGFGIAEWLRGALPWGLAWNAIGLAAMPVPLLMQGAHVLGVAGMSAAAIFVYSTPALLATRLHARAGLTLAAILIAAQLGYGYAHLSMNPETDRVLRVRLVQPVPEAGGDFDETLKTYLELTASPVADGQASPELILWPELSVPFVLAERPDLLDAIVRGLRDDELLIAGTVRQESGPEAGMRRLYNAVVAISKTDGIIDGADKVNIALFVDHLPFEGIFPGAGPDSPLTKTSYSPGSARRLLSVSENIGALPLIGTEAAIPGIAEPHAQRVDLILNPANYSAFAGLPVSYQHLRQAQLRAVEAGLPLLLAMPHGPTAVIDARGRVIDALAASRRGIIDVAVPLTENGMLPGGSSTLRGLVFSAMLGMVALFLIIRVGIPESRD
ncbi:apolipoprotein N-acyltransferase [Chelativorans sp. SCAU2101]|jgi:apolipoprotein N-acyltransferase|uniref:Apolipoprotein N-acyltransferase n=1 Tax=Chelativorans petroleitrophicus TaxID=2975484 RepID=A0A9X2XCI2_9HYPH|nr:apolipoprotein N-acyltransferase [Chelativorans petroleitrophicus]MCT8991995.1 apolipoprotein N-acyltransferase [Chelativorans petroleitrophicus]